MRARRPCRRQFHSRFCLWFYSLLFICESETQPHSLRFHSIYLQRKKERIFSAFLALLWCFDLDLGILQRHVFQRNVKKKKNITWTHTNTPHRNEYGRGYKYENDMATFDTLAGCRYCYCCCIDGEMVFDLGAGLDIRYDNNIERDNLFYCWPTIFMNIPDIHQQILDI